MPDKKKKSTKKNSVIEEARERFRTASDYWKPTFEQYNRCMRFYSDQMWDEATLRERGIDRQVISINECRPKVAQIVNLFKANRPGPKVSPVDSGNDVAGAEVHEGLLRHTDYVSNADAAMDTAFMYAAAGGYGVLGLTYDYASPDSFDMSTLVRRIADPLAVLFDPACEDPNGADAEYAFVKSRIARSIFERRYPNSEMTTSGFYCDGVDSSDWVNDFDVLVCEYYSKEFTKRTLVEIGQGQAMFADDPRFQAFIQSSLELHSLADPETGELDVASVFRTREVDYPSVVVRIINGTEVLEEKAFPASNIPLWYVTGGDAIVENKRRLCGLLDDAITPQMMLNFAESVNLELLSMAPKPKWMIAEGQDEGFEEEYANANRSNRNTIHYKPTTIDGQLVPRPTFEVFEPKSQSFDIAASRAAQYIKDTTGLFDSSLGNIDPRAHSGSAIKALQAAGTNASSHINDSMQRALKWRYRTELEMNSKIMSPGQMVRILGMDQKSAVEMLSDSFFDGKFDATISIAPSFLSQRQEVREFVLGLSQSDPQGFGLVRDIAARLLDFGPLGDQIAKRWTLPQFADENSDPVPPVVKQQMSQLQQLSQAQTQEIHRLKNIIETKQVEVQADKDLENLKFEHAKELKFIDQQTTLLVADAQNDTKRQLGEREERLEALRIDLGQDHERRMQAEKHTHQFALDSAHRAADSDDLEREIERQRQERAGSVAEAEPQSAPEDLNLAA